MVQLVLTKKETLGSWYRSEESNQTTLPDVDWRYERKRKSSEEHCLRSSIFTADRVRGVNERSNEGFDTKGRMEGKRDQFWS